MEMGLIYQLLWLFFVYSFIGWLAESTVAIVKNKKYSSRGVLNGPLCIIYGITAIMITVGFQDLASSWVFLFIGTTSISTVIEWITGRLLEKTKHRRWWDYSKKKWNLDGYICLQYSLLWGVLGVIGLKYINPLLLKLYTLFPHSILSIVLWVLVGLTVVDIIGFYTIVVGVSKKLRQVEEIQSKMGAITVKFGNYIANHINRRLERAYPNLKETHEGKEESITFAEGCGFYKLVMLFFIGAFLGDITETIFCRVTTGIWMSRSSVVWGSFSIVWGLAIMLVTALLYNYRNRSDSFLFLMGMVLGGVYEYLCSVFTEVVFGKVFWDYSGFLFNLGGRINLLYCFFWGIAAVVWFKKLYPFLSSRIEKIPVKLGTIITWVLLIFMVCNISVSTLALGRYAEREKKITAEKNWEIWMDEYYDDEVMERIYPNAKTVD